jgi:hypothetical protein
MLLVVGFSLLVVVWFANVIAMTYGRGVVRAALDEGARAGSRLTASVGECEARAEEVLASLLGGTMGRELRIVCTATPTEVRASATGIFRSWMPPVPDWGLDMSASAQRSLAP